jgi:hypothetical protein
MRRYGDAGRRGRGDAEIRRRGDLRALADTPLIWMGEHLDYLALYEFVLFIEFMGIIGVEIATFDRKLDPYLRLCGFGFCIT